MTETQDSNEALKAAIARREEEADREARKSKISHIITNRPCSCICAVLCFMLLGLVLSALFYEASEFDDREYFVWDDIRVQRVDALNEAVDEVRETELGDRELPLQVEEQRDWNLYLLFRATSGKTVITPENLAIFRSVQNAVEQGDDYTKVCLATSSEDLTCTPVNTFTDWFSANPTQGEIDAEMEARANSADYPENKVFFDVDYTPGNPRATWARSYYQFGLPIQDGSKRYRSSTDDFSAQETFFVDFLLDIESDVVDQDTGSLDIYMFAGPLWDYYFNKLMMEDFLWVIASILFVIVYMMFHTWSVLLPVLGMFQVIGAFPIAYAIYRVVMQIKMFNMMNFFSIFVILGIAADDIFVYVDAWKQSDQFLCLQSDLEKRVAYVYRRAVKAMFITTITTFCAFLATAISEIPPISAFGIFSANMVMSNYLLVITFFPCCVVLRHKFNNRKKAAEENTPKQSPHARVARDENLTGKESPSRGVEEKHIDVYPEVDSDHNNSSNGVTGAAVIASSEAIVDLAAPPTKIELFFEGKFMDLTHKARYFTVIVFIIWFIIATILASQIGPLSETEQFYPDDHMIEISSKALRSEYHKGEDDGEIVVSLVFGIDGLDRSDVVPYDVKSIGEVEWDDSFNLAPTENQERLVALCELLETSSIVQDGITKCFIKDFKEWIIDRDDDEDAFPVEEENFHTELKAFLADPSGYKYSANGSVGYVGDRLFYVYVQAVAPGSYDPYEVMHPRWEKWEDLMDDFNAGSPEGINNGYQTSTMWQWMITERALLRNAFQGMAIAGSIALIVLILSTLNIILAFYSVFIIAGIVVSVLSVVYMLGWDFGMTVSIAVVILIGFSVDYTVHICHAYVESERESRLDKTREAMRKMGVSIIGGAITTFGTGVVLFATTLMFFNRFAWIISSTIFFASAWSLLFFPALLAAFGPTGKTGNLKAYYHDFKDKRARQKEEKLKKNGAADKDLEGGR